MTIEDGVYNYTIPEGLVDFYAAEAKADKDDINFVTEVLEYINGLGSNTDALRAFANSALEAAKGASVAGNVGTNDLSANENKGKVTFSGLTKGYYVIADETTSGGTGDNAEDYALSAVMLDTTDIDISIKASKPTVEKKIVETTADGNPADSNNASIGDYVKYEIKSTVPDMTYYESYYFAFHDQLSKGLTYIDGTDDAEHVPTITVAGETKTVTDDYTITAGQYSDTDGTTLDVVFKHFKDYSKGDEIVFTYWAKINENAVVGESGNPNDVKLIYSNNPEQSGKGDNDDEPNPENPTGETPWDEVITYVTSVELQKVDPNGEILTGAEFEITGTKVNKVLVTGAKYEEDNTNGTYWKLNDDTYTTTDPNGENVDKSKYADTETKYKLVNYTELVEKTEDVSAKGFVGTDGKIKFEGLGAGEYAITELKAPNGYNILAKPITVKISWTAPTTVDYNGNAQCGWKYEWKLDNKDMTAEANQANLVKVVNKSGTELPSTGGMGTTIFYVVGSVLLVGAAVIMIAKRRMGAEK